MSIENDNKSLEKTNAIFNDYFENIDLNSDIEKIYDLIDDDSIYKEYSDNVELSKLRSENHRRYSKINMVKLKGLPNDFELSIMKLKELYNTINSEEILISDIDTSNKIKETLDDIEKAFEQLDIDVSKKLDEVFKINKKIEDKWTYEDFKQLDMEKGQKKELLKLYDELLLKTSKFKNEPYEDLKDELKTQKTIIKILKILKNKEEEIVEEKQNIELINLNEKIDKETIKWQEKIKYLETLIPEESIHKKEFQDFKAFCESIISYDNTNYEGAKQTYAILSQEEKIDLFIKKFEDLFIKEIEDNLRKKTTSKKTNSYSLLKEVIDDIEKNSLDLLTVEEKHIVKDSKRNLNYGNIETSKIVDDINLIIKKLWKEEITDIYKFNPNKEYSFICSNNQFIDEKYQTILLTKDMVENENFHEDYGIGFVCELKNNILYITKEQDVMEVKEEEKIVLKTPNQVKNDFVSFKCCDKIALDGNNTKIIAVYYIKDNNKEKERKAIELANTYKIPLLKLNK